MRSLRRRVARAASVNSLRNRLALVFFAITFLAIAVLYMYVAPGLRSRLLDDQLASLAAAAHRNSGTIEQTIGSSLEGPDVQSIVEKVGLTSGDRVTMLSVSLAGGRPQLSASADSNLSHATTEDLRFGPAHQAASKEKLVTGIESAATGTVAEAALPLFHDGQLARVVVFSAPVSDVVRSSAIVRHEILVAGGLALLLALIGGYLVARALSQRVKRLERAVEQVAGGDFAHPIPVDSNDELGQLAVAFNDMQRQLAQLDFARKRFIATASHELRTPVFSLGGFVELLEDEDLDADTRRRFLDQVRDQVERLRKLSVDLLEISRLDSGSLELRPEQVDLGELTRSVSGEFEPALAQHDAHLELRLATRAIEALCDPVRVAQIMRILLDNALTHNPPGTRIVVTALRENGRVRLAVRDDGVGIPDHALPRIFEPFYTADDGQGSGLGLAIASELAEHMAGRLSVESGPHSTTLTLEIPV
ncbi:MAG TPA: HAMP domain-containing sensor histidine kinase [Solirubrobacteraceae bacterium]